MFFDVSVVLDVVHSSGRSSLRWFKLFKSLGDKVLLDSAQSLREISYPARLFSRMKVFPEQTKKTKEAYPGTMPESRLITLRKESERFSMEIKEKEADNIVLRKQIREVKSTIHQTQRDYDATANGTSKAENQRIKMQKLLKRQKVANEVNAQEKEIGELRLELKRLSKKTFPQFDDAI